LTSQWGKSVRLASVAQLDSSFARTTLPAPVSSATYDAANRILSFDGFTPTYDANGNLTELDGDTYAWNVRDELVSITGPSLSASFGYDAFGRRSQKTVNGQTTHYLADGINPLQEQASAGQNWTALTMTGLGIDEIIARGDASGTYYFLPDGLGSTVALMDGTGAIHTEYTYAPFGETTRTGTVATNPFQFTGRENDNTGLYYYRARYYHPVLQRFMSEDPIGFAGGDVNLYAYVGNAPVNFVDPLGLINLREFLQDLRTKAIVGAIVERVLEEGGEQFCPGTTERALVDVAQGVTAAQSAAFFTQVAIGAGVAAVTVATTPVAVGIGLTTAGVAAVFGGNEIARSAASFQEAFDFFAGEIAPPVNPAQCGCIR